MKLVKTGRSSGARQIPEGAGQVKQMAENDIVMDQGGFLTAYTVNESPASVYIDNFQLSLLSGAVLEENTYYPYGMINTQLSNQGITDPINNYKYNGKELQKDLSLEWLDYGARFYDPQICRWHVPDPLVEIASDWSSYSYCRSNPVNYIDPYGLWTSVPGGYKTDNPEEIDQFFTYLNGEHNVGGDPSFEQEVSFIAWSGSGGGGAYTLSNGSKLILSSINVSGRRVNGVTYWTLDSQSAQRVWQEIQKSFNPDGGGGDRDWLNKTQIGMEAYGVSHNAQGALINYAARVDASISDLKYVKSFKVVGKTLVFAGVAFTGYEVMKDIQNGKFYRAGVRILVFGAAAGSVAIPIVGWGVSAGIGLADAIWGEQFYNWVEK
jgi:RHS repeat-associated protein